MTELLVWPRLPYILAGLIFLLTTILDWVLLSWFARKGGLNDFTDGGDGGLKERLAAYADLKGDCKSKATSDRPEGHEGLAWSGRLESREHNILLGILKKIEAKNAVLCAVTAIVYAGLLAVYVDVIKDALLITQGAMLFAVFQGVFILAVLVGGAAHISNLTFRKHKACLGGGGCVKWAMQRDLMEDLLRKEQGFACSVLVLKILLAIAILCLWVEILIGVF